MEVLLQARWLAITSSGTPVHKPFLVVLLFWLTLIFASFGLFATRNTTVVVVFFVCALSVGSAIFLVLEMNAPFDGLFKVSAEPLRQVLAHLNL